ncbi:hypothetical protein EVAR_17484_1 [Eumeta japonica]|uniref:Uncharacterized protein n=1 Tax=Eumeta variegata TaxID=151549 RepID=A0A4C1ZK84_EUMVA|nr:hypothetical protein EVAR_17484_1 [Eumeta japonica]
MGIAVKKLQFRWRWGMFVVRTAFRNKSGGERGQRVKAEEQRAAAACPRDARALGERLPAALLKRLPGQTFRKQAVDEALCLLRHGLGIAGRVHDRRPAPVASASVGERTLSPGSLSGGISIAHRRSSNFK